MEVKFKELSTAVIRFAGDSGDGMQTVGEQFTDSSALAGNDICTFPDFPAEIRAPIGTLPGVSGFQIQIGSTSVLTPGDAPDALVAMNPAALKVNLKDLTKGGLLLVNSDAFNANNLKKAGYEKNPLEDPQLAKDYELIAVKMTTLTKESLSESPLKPSEKTRCKNFFALGLIYWIYDRSEQHSLDWIKKKWGHNPIIVEANSGVLKTGFYYGDTCELKKERYQVQKAPAEPGVYRKIAGNEALVLGLISASKSLGKNILIGSYPITPASSILEGLAKHKNFGVKTIQAEDEIAAIGISLGGSFAGWMGVTNTSGPGLCLKSEFIGLAVITELPLVIVNVQRGGPSTGLPTKTEQADLLQALYGRNGESPIPIVAPHSPGDCFECAIEATRIAFEYNTPVLLLSDGYIANGSEPWKIPDSSTFPKLNSRTAKVGEDYVIYKRDPETLARDLAIPGQVGLEHRIGGLEKNEEGNVCYDSDNHEKMTHLRADKIAGIAKSYPKTKIQGKSRGKVLVVGWGGTYGAITSAVIELQKEGLSVSSIHLRHLNPLPNDLGDILAQFDHVLVPELNMGQLIMLLRSRYLVDCVPYHKVQGIPLYVQEMKTVIMELLKA